MTTSSRPSPRPRGMAEPPSDTAAPPVDARRPARDRDQARRPHLPRRHPADPRADHRVRRRPGGALRAGQRLRRRRHAAGRQPMAQSRGRAGDRPRRQGPGHRRRGPGRRRRRGGARGREADAWLTTATARGCSSATTRCRGDLEDVTATVVRDVTADRELRCRPGPSVESITAGTELGTEVLVGDAEQRDFAQGMAFALAFLFYLVLRRVRHDAGQQRRRGEAVAHRRDHRDEDPGAPAAGRQGARQHRARRRRRWRSTRRSASSASPSRRSASLPAVGHRRARLVPRLLPRRLPPHRVPVGRGRRAREPHRGRPVDVDARHAAAPRDLLRLGLPRRHRADGAVVRPAGLGGAHAPADPRGQRRCGGSRSSPWRCCSSRRAASSSAPSASTGARCSRPRAGCRCARRGRRPSEAPAGPELTGLPATG